MAKHTHRELSRGGPEEGPFLLCKNMKKNALSLELKKRRGEKYVVRHSGENGDRRKY